MTTSATALPASRRASIALLIRSRAWLLDHLWVLLPLLAVPALWPFVSIGLTRSYDGGLHLLRLALLDRHLHAGTLLPRWAPEMLLGYGYPVYNFYGPASYYLAEGIHLLGFSIYQAFCIAFAVVVLLAGFGAFFLSRDIFGRNNPWSPLVVATAYLYAPYLLDNVYIRGGLAEAGALALLPWILWGLRRLFYASRPLPYLLLVAFSLGTLAITHNITLLFTPPVIIGYAAVHWWSSGRPPYALGWVTLSILAAMGLSAFFWLPLIVERSFLAGTGYTIAREVWLPRSVWTWRNFLDADFYFTHSFARPNRLGLVQLILAMGGFLLARRRDAEWLFLAALAIVASALIGAWALPLWLGSDLLTIAQFPWRLLSIVSLPLAVLTGGWFVRLRQGWLQAGVSLLFLAVIIAAQRPQLDWIDTFAEAGTSLEPAVLAQIELDKGVLGAGEGNSSIQEFRPRWVDPVLLLKTKLPAVPPLQLAAQRANAYDLDLAFTAPVTTTLRFNDLFFPGWRLTLENGDGIEPYPSTNLGLLTVDVPPGGHTLHKSWQDTPVRTVATLISLATLALLAVVAWRDRRTRAWSVLAAILLAVCLTGWLWPRPLEPVQVPRQPVAAHGVQLLGFQTKVSDNSTVTIYPYWYVSAPPPEHLRFHWQILDTQGKVWGETSSYPYYNAVEANNWPVGTLVDDAAKLPVPAGLPAGAYQVALGLGSNPDELAHSPAVIGEFTLARDLAADPGISHPMDVRIGESIHLYGVDYAVNGQPTSGEQDSPLVVDAGDTLQVTLYWGADGLIEENYHGFIHLTDVLGHPVAKEDHVPGPLFDPPATWQPGRLHPDVYTLRVPPDTPSGVYWPSAGMYEFATTERLPVSTGTESTSDDHVRLRPVKIVNRQAGMPQHPLNAHFGDTAELLGYDLALPGESLHAGDRFTVTLYYRSQTPAAADLTRFLHLYSPDLGMAAQFDSPPQGGVNPTWAWTPGEVIVDRVELQVDARAVAGRYSLLTGLYDATAGGARLPVLDAKGTPFPDQVAPLAEITVAP